MNFETTKDVLDHAREFHGQVSEYYRQLSEKVQKEGLIHMDIIWI